MIIEILNKSQGMSQNTHTIPLLVVDRDPQLQKALDSMLPEDYTLFFANSSRKALQMLENQHFGVVITHANAPDIEGHSLCWHIRRKSQNEHTHVLLIAEHGDEEAMTSGIRAGADDYMYKPLDAIDVLARLHIASRQLALNHIVQENKNAVVKHSLYDSLTHVHNRRYFIKQLQQDLQRAERYKHALSVVICNVDQLNHINSQYGHSIGDAVLQSIASNLEAMVRENVDVVGRTDGDEFALLLPETETHHAMAVAHRIREGVAAAPLDVLNTTLPVTVRLGVAGINKVDTEKHTPDSVMGYAKYFVDQGRKCGGNTTSGVDISSE